MPRNRLEPRWPIIGGCLALALTACAGGPPALKTSGDLVAQAKTEIEEVAPSALATENGTLIIDVSEANEYAAGHLPGAIHVPRGMLEFKIDSLAALRAMSDEDRSTYPIVVYCSHGGRGSLAAKALQDMGFTNVRSLRGGLLAWMSREYPVESGRP